MPTLRSSKVWQIWHFAMFLSLLLSRNLTPSLSYHIVHVNESQRWQTFSLFALSELIFPFFTIGISMYQNNMVPYFIITSTFSPQAYSLLERHRRTDRFQHPLLPKFFFFPLSTRGPTRRRTSTGLAELWGGWPIEQEGSFWHDLFFSKLRNEKETFFLVRIHILDRMHSR